MMNPSHFNLDFWLAVPHLTYRGALELSQWNFDRMATGHLFFQAVWLQGALSSPKLYAVHAKVTHLFLALNIGSLLYHLGKLIQALDRGFPSLKLREEPGLLRYHLYSFLGGAALLSWGLISLYAVKKLNGYFKPKPNLQEGLRHSHPERTYDFKNLKIRRAAPASEIVRMGLSFSSLALNATLLLITKKYFYAVNTALAASQLYTQTRFEWIIFKKLLEVSILPDPLKATSRKVLATYQLLMHKLKSSPEGSNCAICLNPEANTYFCASHLFHYPCLVGMVYSHMERLQVSPGQIGELMHAKEQFMFQNLQVKEPAGLLPACPTCRSQPSQNTLTLSA